MPSRQPFVDRNPLDRASFYIESLKYGPRAGDLEPATRKEAANLLEALLRDAGITSMTGAELDVALDYYAESYAEQIIGLPPIIIKSLLIDGLMHGIALTAKLEGELRNPKGR